MLIRMAQAMGITPDDVLSQYRDAEDFDASINDYSAYCENGNHDNCDWRIVNLDDCEDLFL